jgi:AmmeMemoRadiSam system protein B
VTLEPAVAGSWYPASESALAEVVDRWLGRASVPPASARPVGLIAPHAGYAYSGEVASHGFRTVLGARYARVIVVGPSHYAAFRGAVIPDADAYRTPLGAVELDRGALEALRQAEGFEMNGAAFRPEHSVEAEIPFLQRALAPGWRLVPVLVGGGSSGPMAARIARGLRALAGPDTLVVASSDFTHFGVRFGYVPFRDEIPDRIRELDMGALRLIEATDADGLEVYLEKTGATVCGRDAIGVLLRMLPPGTRATLLCYDTSGRLTGDWSHTVSYASVVFGSSAWTS